MCAGDCPSMMKCPSRKLSEISFFKLIFPQMIRIRWYLSEWNLEACRPGGSMRIFVLIFPQVIRNHLGEWEVVVIKVIQVFRQ